MIYKSQLQSIDGSAGYPLQHNALLSLLMRVPVVVATDLCYQVVYTSELPNGTTLHMHIALLLCDHRFCRQVPPKTLSKPAGEVWIIFVFCFDVRYPPISCNKSDWKSLLGYWCGRDAGVLTAFLIEGFPSSPYQIKGFLKFFQSPDFASTPISLHRGCSVGVGAPTPNEPLVVLDWVPSAAKPQAGCLV
jgi:hypothetical protein